MAEWTLAELVERAARALAASGVRAPNARVTAVPDARVIRWYATIGIMDRPSAMRGRVALYGPRHLLQLVAIKRRQAQGRTLAEIQAELVGAPDAVLRRAAGMSAATAAGMLAAASDRQLTSDEQLRSDDRLTSEEYPTPARPPDVPSTTDRPHRLDTVPRSPPRPRFWARPSPTAIPTPAATSTVDPATLDLAWAVATAGAAGGGLGAEVPSDGVVLHGVRLGGAAVLLVPGRPDRDDLAAITTAATPLLAALADRGLLYGSISPRPEGEPA